MKTLCIWLLICSVVTEYAYSAELPKSDEYFDKENSIEENNEQLIESNNAKNKRKLYLLTTARLDSLALQDPPTSACGGPGDYCDESMLCCKGYDCVTRSTGPDYPVCTAINRKLHVSKTRHRHFEGKKMKAQRKINHNARLHKFQDPPKTMYTCGGPGDYCNTSMPCCDHLYCVCVMDRPDECTGGSRRSSHVSKIQQRQPDGKKKLNSQRNINLTALALQDPPKTDCGGPGDNCNTSMPCCEPFQCSSDEGGSDTVCKAFGSRSSHVSKIREHKLDGKKKLNSTQRNTNLTALALQDPPKNKCGGPGAFCNTLMLCCYPLECVSVMDRLDECTAVTRRPSLFTTIRQRQLNGTKKLNSTQRNINLSALAFQDPPKTDCGGPGDNCNTSTPCCEPFKCASDEGGSDTVCKAFGSRPSHVSKIREHKPDGKKKLNSTQPFVNLNALAFQDPPPTTNCSDAGAFCNTTMLCCEGYACVIVGSFPVCAAIHH